METKTIKLKTPIVVNGELATEITATDRKMTFGVVTEMNKPVREKDPLTGAVDFRPKTEMELTSFIIGFFFDLSAKEVSALDMGEIESIMEAIEPFLSFSQGATTKNNKK